MSLLECGNTRLAPLDTVEPDWYGNANSLSEKHTALVAKWKGHGTLGLYSRETVESLLEAQRAENEAQVLSLLKEHELRMAEYRKEALLEAANKLDYKSGYPMADMYRKNLADELRRMAADASSVKSNSLEGEK